MILFGWWQNLQIQISENLLEDPFRLNGVSLGSLQVSVDHFLATLSSD
jgi:hypothetical protein